MLQFFCHFRWKTQPTTFTVWG